MVAELTDSRCRLGKPAELVRPDAPMRNDLLEDEHGDQELVIGELQQISGRQRSALHARGDRAVDSRRSRHRASKSDEGTPELLVVEAGLAQPVMRRRAIRQPVLAARALARARWPESE